MTAKSEQHLSKLINRLRTVANVLDKEGGKEPNGEIKKARAAGLRAAAREVEGWLKQWG